LALSLVILADVCSHAQQSPPPSPTPSPTPAPASPPVHQLPELRVPGFLDQGYVTRDSVTGTKTDTPFIETPAVTDVINRKQLDDQRLLSLPEALQWVPGFGDESSRGGFERFTLRGFFAGDNTYLDGLRVDPRFWVSQEMFGMERVEVLKGPASVLYGQVEPGGLVNLVSKRPLPQAHYDFGYTGGSFSFNEVTGDVGGPITDSKSVLYRVTARYLNTKDFVDFVGKERVYVAPALTLRLGTDTTLTLLANYITEDWVQSPGIPAEGTVLSNPNGRIPIKRFVGEPRFNQSKDWRVQGGYQFDHRFTENLVLHQGLRVQSFEFDDDNVRPDVLLDDQRTVTRFASGDRVRATNVGVDTNLAWTVKTGPITHRLLGGVDFFWDKFADRFYFVPDIDPIDVFDPVYGAPVPVTRADWSFDSTFTAQQLGVYVQDQMRIWDRLTILMGARFDNALVKTEDHIGEGTSTQHDQAPTWRIGLLYQFLPGFAGFASYATSFLPVTFGAKVDGSPLKPETGEQWETGVKLDLLGGRLTSTLAFYQITRQNVITDDLDNPGFSIQTGEQRSRGIEWDARARIVPGWDILAYYSYIDAVITSDTVFPTGNRVPAVPLHTAGLWTTWEFPSGPLKGLGAGFGGRYVGSQQLDLANSLKLPDYGVLDASVFYRWGPARAQVNFKNLTNEKYYAGNSRFVQPGEPFSVLGQLTLSFR
jgi:iron complex outermembrane receptor protein